MKILTERFCKETLFHPFSTNEVTLRSRVAAVALWVFTLGIFPLLVIPAVNRRFTRIQIDNASRLKLPYTVLRANQLPSRGEFLYSRILPTTTIMGIEGRILNGNTLPSASRAWDTHKPAQIDHPIVRCMWRHMGEDHPFAPGIAARTIDRSGNRRVVVWKGDLSTDRANGMRAIQFFGPPDREFREVNSRASLEFFAKSRRLLEGKEFVNFDGVELKLDTSDNIS